MAEQQAACKNHFIQLAVHIIFQQKNIGKKTLKTFHKKMQLEQKGEKNNFFLVLSFPSHIDLPLHAFPLSPLCTDTSPDPKKTEASCISENPSCHWGI